MLQSSTQADVAFSETFTKSGQKRREMYYFVHAGSTILPAPNKARFDVTFLAWPPLF